MKLVQNARNVFTMMGVIAGLALATGWIAPSNAAAAGSKAFNMPRVYSYSFGTTQTGSWFATMHKTGEVTTDQVSFNFDKATAANLGPGHGVWKYNANKNKVTIVTFHTDRDNASGYWKIIQTVTQDESGNQTGTGKAFKYAALGDSNAQDSYNALCTNENIDTW